MPGNRGIFKVMLKKGIPIKMQESLALQSSLTDTASHFLLTRTVPTTRAQPASVKKHATARPKSGRLRSNLMPGCLNSCFLLRSLGIKLLYYSDRPHIHSGCAADFSWSADETEFVYLVFSQFLELEELNYVYPALDEQVVMHRLRMFGHRA